VLLELASKAQELISCLVWLNWHPWGVASLLIVVILDGALPSTVSGTLPYAEAAGQKVNYRPLAEGRKFKFGFGPEGGGGETGQLCTGARRLLTQYLPLAAVGGAVLMKNYIM
jgi:hypothetical protein